MATQVVMPQLGESIVEGIVNKWLVQEGDPIKRFDALLEVGSDKIDTEVPSPADGVLLKIYVAEGETVDVGTIIAVVGQAGETIPEISMAATEVAPPVAAVKVETAPISAAPAMDLGFISPVVARLAAEHGVDLTQLVGTGLKGRIRKQDVLEYLEQERTGDSDASIGRQPVSGDRVVPLNRIRRLIAGHMVQSKRTSPHVTTVFDCDLSAVVRHREAHADAFAQDGVNLTFTPYFITAIASALKQHPYVNSSWSEKSILLKQAINVGMATAIDDGLVVPVIKNTDSFNLLGLARIVNDLTHRARSGQLEPDELQDGTFTLTNHGTSGSLFATPIIHQPQTGILGVGKIHKAPVVLSQGHGLLPDANDAIAIRPIAYLSFSFDHRLLDGAAADAFVAEIKERLEFWPED